MEETVHNLIKSGKRNFAVDLSGIDYLYSDSINKFIKLNHDILKVFGHLALLSPGDEVSRVLKRAGVENFIRVYADTNELKLASDEIIQQTSAVNTAAVKEFRPEKNVSEFEDFRSEMGKAFDVVPQTDEPESFSTIQQPETEPAFENMPEVQSRVIPEPEVEAIPRQEFISPKIKQPVVEFSKPVHESRVPSAIKGPEREKLQEDRFGSYDKKSLKKKTPVMIIVLVLVLIAGVAGIYFYLSQQAPKEKTAEPIQQKETPVVDTVPQIATPPDSAVKDTPIVSTAVEEKKVSEPAEKGTNVIPKKYIKSSTSKTKSTENNAAQTPTGNTGGGKQIMITSSPSGATVSINGKVKGVTPYIWNNPNVFGMVSITIDKKGFTTEKIDFEYTGSTVNKHIVLAQSEENIVSPEPEKKVEPPVQNVKPREEPVQKTVPVVQETEPVEKPAKQVTKTSGGTPGTIFITSIPPLADVYMDGVKIGKTNIEKLKISSGTHSMRFVKGTMEITKEMTFSSGDNPSQIVRLK